MIDKISITIVDCFESLREYKAMLERIFLKLRYLFFRLRNSPEKYLRAMGAKVGTQCCIKTWNFGSEPYLIEIGNHVQITSGTSFITHTGGWLFRDQNPDFDMFGRIQIKDNVYIGNNVIVLPGVTIGENSLIGAGTIVSRSIPSGSVVAGIPCRIISTIDEFISKQLQYNCKTKFLTNSQKKELLLSGKLDHLFVVKDYLTK